MEYSNRRKQERYDSLNLLNYICIDADGREWKQGMGRTLNISQAGVKLETHTAIETQFVMLLSIGIEDHLVDIKGKVIYCNRGDQGRFESGIAFSHIDSNTYTALERFIREFENQYG